MDRSILERPFEDALIRSRQGPFGKTFSYVEGAEYIKRLNEALEGDWSFEIVQHQILDAEVFVLGKLVVGAICKMAFGGSSITVSRDGEVLSLADDLKAASTDSLKNVQVFSASVYTSTAAMPQPTHQTVEATEMARPPATATATRIRETMAAATVVRMAMVAVAPPG